jgi:hypothetical protein
MLILETKDISYYHKLATDNLQTRGTISDVNDLKLVHYILFFKIIP